MNVILCCANERKWSTERLCHSNPSHSTQNTTKVTFQFIENNYISSSNCKVAKSDLFHRKIQLENFRQSFVFIKWEENLVISILNQIELFLWIRPCLHRNMCVSILCYMHMHTHTHQYMHPQRRLYRIFILTPLIHAAVRSLLSRTCASHICTPNVNIHRTSWLLFDGLLAAEHTNTTVNFTTVYTIQTIRYSDVMLDAQWESMMSLRM